MSAGHDFPRYAPQNAVREATRRKTPREVCRKRAKKGIMRVRGQRSRNRPQRVRRLRPPIATNDRGAANARDRRSQQTTATRPTLASADRNKRLQCVRRLRLPIAANGRSERSRQNKKDPPVPQNEKVLTRSRRWVRRCGASDFPLKKQTLPIAADHFTGAPVVQLWIKIIRTPNTADLK